MPDLTQLLANPGVFPQQTGQPTGVVNIPAVGLSGDTRQGSGLATGLNTLGQGIENVGRGLLTQGVIQERHRLLEAKRQEALDKLDTLTHYNGAVQELDTFVADSLRNPDTRNHPRRVKEFADGLLQQRVQHLSPTARGLFTSEFTGYLATVNREALKVSTQADLAQAKVQLKASQDTFVRQMLNSQDEAAQAQVLTQFQQSLVGLEQAGLAYPAETEAAYQAGVAEFQQRQNDLFIEQFPDRMQAQARKAAAGLGQDPNLPTVRRDDAVRVLKTAQEVIQRNNARDDRDAQLTEKAVRQVQDATTTQFRTRISELPLAAQSIPQLDALLRQVNQEAMRQRLTPEQQSTLDSLIQSRRQASLNPPTLNDPATELRLTRMVHRAQLPGEFQQVREELDRVQHLLLPDTWQKLDLRLTERQRSDDYSNRPSFRNGRRILEQGIAIVTSSGVPIVDSQRKLQNAELERQAFDVYDQTLRAMALDPKQGVQAVDAQAVEIAWSIRGRYLDRLATEQNLPPWAQGFQDRDAFVLELNKHPEYTPDQRAKLLGQWHALRESGKLTGRPAPTKGTP